MCIRDRPYAVPICSFRSAPASSTTNSPTTSTAGTPTSPEHRTPRLRRSPRDPLTCGWGLPHLDTPRGIDPVFAARLPRKVAVSLGVPAVVVICRSGGTGFVPGVTWHRCRGVLGMLWWTTASSSLTAVTPGTCPAAARSAALLTDPDSVTTPSRADTPSGDATFGARRNAALTSDCNSMLPRALLDTISVILHRPR